MPENVEGAPLAVYDSTGLVFGVSAAIAGGEGYVSLGLETRIISFSFSISSSDPHFTSTFLHYYLIAYSSL